LSVTVRDKGLVALLGRLKQAHAARVSVGVHGDAPSRDGGSATNVEVATYQEFGTATIPARSFVRATVDEQAGAIQGAIRKAAEGIVKGLRPSAAMTQIGALVVGMMQRRMSQGIPPPLKSRAGTPLIDTGQLRASITSKVSFDP